MKEKPSLDGTLNAAAAGETHVARKAGGAGQATVLMFWPATDVASLLFKSAASGVA
jgi:hypothetical protein